MNRSACCAALVLVLATTGRAQNGVSDDRVSLPDGPGSIGGVGENIEINANQGTSSFSVPLRVPEGGTSDMTPRLALTYSSGAGLGAAGMGWDLPTPVIERMVSKGLPEYDVEDFFAADGSELVFVGAIGGVREYRARFEGAFVRYRWHDAGAAGYWTAEDPTGRTATYGATADGTLVNAARVSDAGGRTFRYHLVEIRNTSGRRMVQTFVKTNGWPRLDEIQYGFGGQATPRFSVRLGYEARPDVMTNATPGHVIRLDQRLNAIQVLSGNQVIRRFTLTYEPALEAGGMSRLQVVREFGRDGGLLPIVHTFSYSRSLGDRCDVGCEQPFLVNMGTLPGGVSIATGRAGLVDFNGDSLPDIVSADGTGAHTIHLSSLIADGRPRFVRPATTSSMGNTALRFVLGAPSVQLLDVNGDGLTDIVDQQNGTALCNFGNGDWESAGCVASPDQLPTLPDDAGDPASDHEPFGMRFFDYDNDKRIDLLQTSSASATQVFANVGGTFVATNVTPIGAQFDVDDLQLSDINGDGLQDPVLLVGDGANSILRSRLNLGFGNWDDFVDQTVPGLAESEIDNAELEDIDGDGLSDVVVVSGTTISYWRNENGRFAAREDITSADVTGGIPDRDGTQTILFADMNGNGTDDVVFISNDGLVQFVELFPVRPNLLDRVDNGIGWTRLLRYGTAIAERARDEGTADAWVYKQPNAMVIVKSTDDFVTLTASDDGSGIHEVTEYAYHSGYYDPGEKQFKGFERVERRKIVDADEDGQEPSREVTTFDVGEDDIYAAGNVVRSQIFGGIDLDLPIRETRTTYADCDLGGNLATLDPPVRFVCPTSTITIQQEGRPESEWATLQTDQEHDIYGNIVRQTNHGVIHRGSPEAPQACDACDGPAGLFSGACGATCGGDELVEERTYVDPATGTGGRWLLRLPVRQVSYATDATEGKETLSFYDGADFVGLDAGEATRGLLTRQLERRSAEAFVTAARNAWDAIGALVASIDPNGSIEDPTSHRRQYTYDDRGLRVASVTLRGGTSDLVQRISYEAAYLQPSEATTFIAVQGGVEQSNANATRYRYDEHGRIEALIRPGDSDAAPSEVYTYDLAAPASRITTSARQVPGGPLNVVTSRCVDGRGRTVQTRRQVSDADFIVDGFVEYNSDGAVVRRFQPYTSSTAACEAAPPAGVLASSSRYDALGREVASTIPDAAEHGTESFTRTEYRPLEVIAFDEGDTDEESVDFNTPTRRILDGLGRVVAIERLLTPTTIATYRMAYDERGNLAEVRDPGGNTHEQRFDFRGLVIETTSVNGGDATFEYDDAGLLIRKTDARGIQVDNTYDGLNRPVATFAVADRAGTEERTVYDLDPDCSACVNGAGRPVSRSFPGGSEQLSWDPQGRLVQRRRVIEGIEFITGYTWDGRNNLIETTYPDGGVVRVGFDRADRATSVDGFVTATAFDARGRVARITHSNGVEQTFSHDATGYLSGHTAGDIYDVAFTRDRTGNITAIADGGSALSQQQGYSYDAWSRLIRAEGGGETIDIAYDVLDNITRQTSSRGAASAAHVGDYVYDASRANAIVSAGDTAWTHDAAGNVVTRGELALQWDHLSRLSGATGDAVFAYGPGGDRMFKRELGGRTYFPSTDFAVRDGIATTTVRLGDVVVGRRRSVALATVVLTDENGDGVIDISDAVLGDGGADAHALLRAAARRQLFAAGEATATLIEDFRSTVVAATDGAGNLLAARTFHPFGEEAGSTGFVDDLGFSGQERDASTGLTHFRYRYLDTQVGRWTATDPLFGVLDDENVATLGQSTTAYAYVANNAINTRDIDGRIGKTLKRALNFKKRQQRKQEKKLLKARDALAGDRESARRALQQANRDVTRILRADTVLTQNVAREQLIKMVQRLNDDGSIAMNRHGRTFLDEDNRLLDSLIARTFGDMTGAQEAVRARDAARADFEAIDSRFQRATAKLQEFYNQRAGPSRAERNAVVNASLQDTFGFNLGLR